MSVGVPTYSQPEFLRRALASLVGQDWPNLEIIVSDNHSPDGRTEAVVREFMAGDPRIVFHRQARNIGAGANFRFVLGQARGDYFMWAADDDWFEPGFITACVAALDADPQLGLASGRCRYYVDGSSPFDGEFLALDQDSPGQRVSRYLEGVLNNNIFYGLYRREWLGQAKIDQVFAGDWLFIVRLLLESKAVQLLDAGLHREFRFKSTDQYLAGVEGTSILDRWLPYTAFSLRVARLLWTARPDGKPLKGRVALALRCMAIVHRRFFAHDRLQARRKLAALRAGIGRVLHRHYHDARDALRTLASRLRASKRPAIAWFSPMPPTASGIADYSVDLLRGLAGEFDVDVFVEDGRRNRRDFGPGVRVFGIGAWPALRRIRRYRRSVFQVGNHAFHDYLFAPMAHAPSPLVVLHDGMNFPQAAARRPLLDRADVIVHNAVARDAVLAAGLAPGRVHEVEHMAPLPWPAEGLDAARAEARAALGVAEGTFVVASFGLATPAKQTPVMLRAAEALAAEGRPILCLVAGHALADPEAEAFLARHRDDPRYRVLQAPTLDGLYRLMLAADLCFNLRHPYHGETSGALLRVMSCATPCVVTDVGSFAALPDEVVLKTRPGISVDECAALMRRARDDEAWRRALGRRGHAFVRDRHGPDAVLAQWRRLLADDRGGA